MASVEARLTKGQEQIGNMAHYFRLPEKSHRIPQAAQPPQFGSTQELNLTEGFSNCRNLRFTMLDWGTLATRPRRKASSQGEIGMPFQWQESMSVGVAEFDR